MIRRLTVVLALVPAWAHAQRPVNSLGAAGTPVNRKVAIVWNRYHDSDALKALSQKIVNAYPDLAKFDVIGKSTGGKDIWCLTITDFKKGDPASKPGMFLNGHLHGNEIQGG